jgi:ATP-dependent Clp protease adaptor protein ClpS
MPFQDSHALPDIDLSIEIKEPPMFSVILLNDDFTPMNFVVEILETIFNKKHEEAVQIMLNVHEKGQGICGTYPHAIAETKVHIVISQARENHFPLQCVMEETK